MVGSTPLAAGAIIGIRHALETDHLAAVVTIVEADTKRPSLVGASWGIGHSLPIAILGLIFVVLGIQLPETVIQLFEAFVGIILIYLGGRMLWTLSTGIHSHDHDHGPHSHLELCNISLGPTHRHLDEESFFVGIIHGFAGSGALVILLASTVPTLTSALSFLATFSLLSILTMAAISLVWCRTLDTPFTTYLQGFVGLFGIGIGVLLVAEHAAGLGVI